MLPPEDFSNTHIFYKSGSSGINIDATPGSMFLFNIFRRRDINLELAISSENNKILDFFMFESSAINTFDKDLFLDRVKHNTFKQSIKLKTYKLSDILNKYAFNREIDLLSIDTEGHDFDVLQSNDWIKYRPMYVLIEEISTDYHNLSKLPSVEYLKSKGYKIIAFTDLNILFTRCKNERRND